jgi:hypothetical protein
MPNIPTPPNARKLTNSPRDITKTPKLRRQS